MLSGMAKNQGKNGASKSKVIRDVPLACSDERAAVEFLERQRWGDSPQCPHCTSGAVYQMADAKTFERSRRFLWRCRGCKKQYTVRVGTVIEDSKIPLRHWCYAFWAACASKKGVSALQIKRQTGVSYESALFMLHRVRYAMADQGPRPKLDGTVEVDETYVGGKPRNPGDRSRPLHDRKVPVLALVQRNGDVRAVTAPRVTGATLHAFIRENVAQGARIITDEHAGYAGIAGRMKGVHETVNHTHREYARGDVTTNRAEGFFSLLKRGLIGTYHSVSRQHLHRYVGEFAFRYNTRKMDDGQRVTAAIRKGVGKRLTYRTPA